MRTFFALLIFTTPICAQAIDGNSTIRTKAGDSEIVITTTNRLAGAIHSLTWNGKEFINSADHGRQLQSASSFSEGKMRHWAESYNPTEAGSRRDGAGPKSTSQLLFLKKSPTELQTISRMAFWLTPDEKSSGHDAINKQIVSDHILTKRVRLNPDNKPHRIAYDVTFSTPIGEQPAVAQFEALTGYMPFEFDHFWKFVPKTSQFEELSKTSGEQPFPVTLATADSKYAMGIFAPDHTAKGFGKPSYGRFEFPGAKVVKWNCVFRKRDEKGLPPGDYSFAMTVLVGTLEDVRTSYIELFQESK